MERSYFRTVCDDAKRNIHTIFTENGVFSPPPPFSRREPCSMQSTMHYSFDMAQQVHYPSNPFQPGPIYFLTPRKCALFGVCCEAIPRQINYLIDEACNTGKGSNTIVSLLHHFFEVHGLGEQQVHLHADNCVGQNKNNTMLHYLLWRTLVGLHTQITLSFLVVGHTKFAPDWCFGLLKQRFRRTNVGCLDDIAQVVDSSASANVAQLVGTQEGEMVVQMYDWTGMFAAHFCKLKNIKAYHHFRFDASMPGAVFFKATSNSEEEMIVLQKNTTWSPVASDLPEPVSPAGLSLERQWYLHNNIAEYCPEAVRDRVCPKPVVPLVTSSRQSISAPTTIVSTSIATSLSSTAVFSSPAPLSTSIACSSTGLTAPLTKKACLCSRCKQSGHNARSCGN